VTAFTDGGAPVRYWALELFTGHLWAWAALVPVVALVVFAGWKARRDRTTGVQTED
jgi:hypothetical protein